MTISELLDKCINENLLDLTISGRKDKKADGAVKVKIRPIKLKTEIYYQASEYIYGKRFL